MQIKVFTTIDESWDSGDFNNSHKTYFTTEELRDDYFDNILRAHYLNHDMEEYKPNSFCEKTGSKRWSYSIGKDEETIKIIEEKTW